MDQYIISGMSCAACQARIEKTVAEVEGVKSVSVSLLTNTMGVEGGSAAKIIRAVEAAGYGAKLKDPEKSSNPDALFGAEEEALTDRESPKLKRRLIASVTFLVLLMYITMGHNMLDFPLPKYFEHNHLALAMTQLLLSAAVMIINGRFFISGFKALLHRAPNMDTLVALGSAVSFGWSVFVMYKMFGMITGGHSSMDLMEMYHDQLYFESAAMIPALITVGKLLEAISKGRTTDALKSLMKLAPKTAVVIRDGKEKSVGVEEVMPGDIFVVRPGESIPVDGLVIEGFGAVNESALTGESVPVDKATGSNVSAATINSSGLLKCRATRVGKDTTLARIVKMVSDAAATKAPVAKIADRVSGIFVPVVMVISLLVLSGWLIAGASFVDALERAICVLVISCPCALGLATPVAIMVGNGMGARNGILFKTGEALESAGKLKIAALDKTGTITMGKPVVTGIRTDGASKEELLGLACSLEQASEHPLAAAVMSKADELGIKPLEIMNFEALPGNGLKAEYKDGSGSIYGGSLKYIETVAAVPDSLGKGAKEDTEQGFTPLFFAKGNKVIGVIAVADAIKEDSPEAIEELKRLGLRVVMLTGDNPVTAENIGRKAGVDRVVAGVLPGEKQRIIEELKKYGATAMVGDGINDAPALTAADTGIAIGAGTDVAIDSAGVVLMNSSLKDVAAAVRLSRKTLTNIRENLFWAFFYNLICIPLAAGVFGLKMNPMIGAAAMSLSSFTVCMNALRLNLADIRNKAADRPGKNMPVELPLDFTSICGCDSMCNIKRSEENMEKTLKIDGMMCAHCEANVKKALEELDFVSNAKADHESKTAVVTLNGAADEALIKKTIEDKGYTYLGME